jgi:hypothetical protein
LAADSLYALGWRVGVWLSDPNGSEETPPTCRIAAPSLGQRESVGNGAETKRPTGLGYEAFVTQSVLAWKR